MSWRCVQTIRNEPVSINIPPPAPADLDPGRGMIRGVRGRRRGASRREAQMTAHAADSGLAATSPRTGTPEPLYGGRQPRRITVRDIAAAKARGDRKSTRLNSSHVEISYAVFC